MHSKLSEQLNAFPSGVWVAAALYMQYMGVAFVQNADGGESVTVQLRKATDSSGTNAANFGTAKTVTLAGTSPAANELITAAQDGRSDELGDFADGVPFTHVSVSVSDSSSPESVVGFLVVGDPRFSADTLAGLGNATP